VRFCSRCGAELPHDAPVTCPNCGLDHYRNAKPTAGALVVRDGKLLLMRRAHDPWRGYWNIPGGFAEEDEPLAECARREVLEETGVDVRVTGFLGSWLAPYDNGDGIRRVALNCFFHARPTGAPDIAFDPQETSEIAWFDADRLPLAELAFPEYAADVLRSWVRAFAAGVRIAP
jgi:ADP-ribose pyrophosphatase YjhB (NUDIX family)